MSNFKKPQNETIKVKGAEKVVTDIEFEELKDNKEVETDLEMAGESITELDMPRTKAIEERDKAMRFMNNEDE